MITWTNLRFEFIWEHCKEKLIAFFEYLNNLILFIKFMFELKSNNSLPPLDVLVICNQESMYTTVYYKPTRIHNLYKHPDHIKRGKVISTFKNLMLRSNVLLMVNVIKRNSDFLIHGYSQEIC